MFKNFIGGEWVDGARASRNVNPSDTGDILGEYAQADAAQTRDAIAAARRAFPAWSLSTPQQRFDLLDAVAADFQFHQEVARATQNDHFADLMTTLGSRIIPRARLEPAQVMTDERREYLRRVNGEHESIYDAIASQDGEGARAAMRTHLANSRERRRRSQTEPR